VKPEPFFNAGLGYSVNLGDPLPALNLPRVYVLVGFGTASASESIINGLRGVNVQVYAVGNDTRGKPYGFYPWPNCGTTYFAIQFKAVNAKGFGDYADGFIVGGTGDAGLPGCVVPDDFSHALGDPAEARLSTALYLRANGTCPPSARRADARVIPDGIPVKDVWRQNRWYR
jgi:hypothetical protein